MELAVRFGYMFLIVFVGVGTRHMGILTEVWNQRLAQTAFYVLMPALIFVSTYDEQLDTLLSVELVVGLVTVFSLLLALSWMSNRHGTDKLRSVTLIQSYHGNFGYFGVPVVAATFGSTAVAIASVILGLGTLIQVPLTIYLLVRINDSETDILREVKNVVTNPILFSLAVSLCFATFNLPVPKTVDAGLSWVSALALPVALLTVGGSLQISSSQQLLAQTGKVVGLKVLVMPLVAWLVFSGLGTDILIRNASVIMFGAPSAVSTYVYTSELGGDAALASVNVFVTTIASIGSLFVLLQFIL